MSRRLAGRQFFSPLEFPDAFRKLVDGQQASSQQNVGGGKARLQANGFAELCDGPSLVAALLINCAQVMVDEGNIAALAEYTQEGLLGFIQVSRLLGLDPGLE